MWKLLAESNMAIKVQRMSCIRYVLYFVPSTQIMICALQTFSQFCDKVIRIVAFVQIKISKTIHAEKFKV